MGTRSNTLVIDTGYKPEVIFVNMYRQMDGYPSGHGKDLAEFLMPFTMVNGMGLRDTRKIANGVGCLAAQIVAHFKTGPGHIYLDTPTKKACGNDYTYIVRANTFEPGEAIQIEVLEWGKRVFVGGVAALSEFCEKG